MYAIRSYYGHKKDSIQVVEPDAINVEIYTQDPACYGDSTGEISLLITGGTPDYTIVWNGGLYYGSYNFV